MEVAMRILIDATVATEGRGGLLTYLLGLIRGWTEAGFDDRWILQGTGDLAESVKQAASGLAEVHQSPPWIPAARMVVQQTVLPRLIAKTHPEVLLCMTPVVPVLARRLPTVAVVHDLRHVRRPEDFGGFQNRYRRLMWPVGLRRADLLIADSERTRADLEELYPYAAGKTSTVHLGCDHVPQAEGVAPSGHGIAFARWSNKRPDFAIEAWAELRKLRPDLNRSLHVVGVESDRRPGLLSLAKALGVNDLVVVHPFLDDEPFWQLFSSAGVVLFPSYFEGFGLPVLEAMRLGVPVVTWRDPAITEIAGPYAWYTEPNPAAFAVEVHRILIDPDGAKRHTKAAFQHSLAWTWKSTAQKSRAVLQEAIARRR